MRVDCRHVEKKGRKCGSGSRNVLVSSKIQDMPRYARVELASISKKIAIDVDGRVVSFVSGI